MAIKLSINSITCILAKKAILKCEQLCACITHDYNSNIINTVILKGGYHEFF